MDGVSSRRWCEQVSRLVQAVKGLWTASLHGGGVNRPASLYNTMFNKVALAFFEARKVLLERLVVKHRLNVLHLDADTIWFDTS